MSNPNEQVRSRLQARLRSLEDRLAEMQETLRQPEDDDLEEQAVEIEDDEVLERLSRAGKEEAQLLRAALRRIEQRSYGKCVSCGKPISERRLRALPEASTCMPCARGRGD